jgi:hypothetical protein
MLSYSEVSTMLTCGARWDLSYGGRLAGDALTPRQTAAILSDGRAWGAAVARFHAATGLFGPIDAHDALVKSLYADARESAERGFDIAVEDLLERQDNLGQMLDHYMQTAERLDGLEQLEREIAVPLPSRSGRTERGSNRYWFHCFIDGHWTSDHPWIVEFKLRDSLGPTELIDKQPQYRWYAWARARELKWSGPVGVLIDERLKQVPLPARIVQAKRKGEGVNGRVPSHADQLTTVDRYDALCQEFGIEPNPVTREALGARTWQRRTQLILTPSDLAEAGRELSSAAQQVRDHDSGRLWPIRNGSPAHCRGCRFKAICSEPQNSFEVNALFERHPAKREREPMPA